jgi:hypothetical protein
MARTADADDTARDRGTNHLGCRAVLRASHRSAGRAAILAVLGLCPLALGACGDTIQAQPVAHNVLEGLVAAPYPVYWLGDRFSGLSITEAVRDPGGAYSVQYGNCVEGGQGSCTPVIRVVTSPDNSFVPGGQASSRTLTVRGVSARSSRQGRTLALATAGVVVDVFAQNASLADTAAQTMVPINAVASPGSRLPAGLPDTGFGERPLPSQVPSPVKPLG